MPVTTPPQVALDKYLGPTTRHTRRIEIYEADGVTRWVGDTVSRLKDGGVSVDYTRDERRGLDLKLDNSDGGLVNAPGQFWYDKIIKVFRGVKIDEPSRPPRVLILADSLTVPQAPLMRTALAGLGYGDVRINTAASSYTFDVAPYDIIVALGGTTDQSALLNTAYQAGKSIFVFRESAERFYNAVFGSTITWPYKVTRTNLVLNAGFRVNNALWTDAGWSTGGAGTISWVSNGGQSGTRGAYHKVWTTASTADGSAHIYQTGIPVTTGQTYTGSIWVKTNKVRNVLVRLAWRTAGDVSVSNSDSAVVATVANTWTRISMTAVAPATAALAYLQVLGTSTGVVYAIGDTADYSDALFEASGTVGTWFDGASTGTADLVYTWAGTANASASTEVAYSRYVTADNTSMAPIAVADLRTTGWSAFNARTDGTGYRAPAAGLSGVFGIAWSSVAHQAYSISAGASTTGTGKYVAVHYPITSQQWTDPQFLMFMLSQMEWLNQIAPLASWEVQIGEFMIDRIVEPNRPRELQITGRDYTKKCMLSKYTGATMYAAGQTLEGLVAVISANAGITKKILPVTGIVISQAFTFDRNTSRWDAMKQICTAYNYEIYFDATGYLVIRPFRDPTTTPPTIWIETGTAGQIASYQKSTSDASLFNHILVAGESSDANIPPVSAQSINTDDTTNTSVNKIGDRYFEYSSPFITTTAQAQALADTYKSIYSLEEFELSFVTLMLPWLEVGDIMGWVDPKPAPGDPSTFLLSSLSLPLSLGPMSSTAKRLTIVS